jgi:hypothetical protein
VASGTQETRGEHRHRHRHRHRDRFRYRDRDTGTLGCPPVHGVYKDAITKYELVDRTGTQAHRHTGTQAKQVKGDVCKRVTWIQAKRAEAAGGSGRVRVNGGGGSGRVRVNGGGGRGRVRMNEVKVVVAGESELMEAVVASQNE